MSLYLNYLNSAGVVFLILCLLLYLFSFALKMAIESWIGEWANSEDKPDYDPIYGQLNRE